MDTVLQRFGSPHAHRGAGRAGALALVGVLLLAVWCVTYVGGGTRTVLPHLFYVPIMVAALLFGFRGGVATAVVSTLLCGPLMPFAVETGQQQAWLSWMSRGVFFLVVGSLAGEMLRHRSASYERELAERFQREIDLATAAASPSDAPHQACIAEVLRTRAFHAVFQPIYSLEDGRLFAVEALTRFTTEPRQPPDVWFEQAAAVGRGADLELAAIERAVTDGAALPDHVELSVNCSPSTLTDPRFHQLVTRHPDRRLIVEVTEHAVVDDYPCLERSLSRLRQLGVRLAVDDAGAGISSLRHIVRLAPDLIKLDISLTQHLQDDPVRRALADCLIQFAAQTGSQLVAEGIEEPADLLAWGQLGACAAQGYLLGRPGPLPFPAISAEVVGLLGRRTPVHPHA